MSDLAAFIIFALLEVSICACAAWVMVHGKEGWGWLIFLAFVILASVKIHTGSHP